MEVELQSTVDFKLPMLEWPISLFYPLSLKPPFPHMHLLSLSECIMGTLQPASRLSKAAKGMDE